MNYIKKFIWKNKIAIGACVLVLAFGVGYWVLSSPGTSTIGEDITAGGRVCDGLGNCLDTVSGGFDPASYSGEQSVTFPNGMIMKMGSRIDDGPVLFSSSFPNAIISVNVTPSYSNSYQTNSGVSSVSVSGFTIRSVPSARVYWMAIGY